MNSVICDCCKKVVPGAKRKQNYFTFQYKSLCTECNNKWDAAVRSEMAKKTGYSLKGYKETMQGLMAKITR